MRQAPRTDANQGRIVKALRQCGCSVTITAGMSHGFPDLIVGCRGETWLFEVKDGDKPPSERKLTDDEEKWIKGWRGRPVVVVESVEDALAALGIVRPGGRTEGEGRQR